MNQVIHYALQVNIVFIILYSFYRLVLHHTRYFGLNRFLLLAFIPISFIVPVIEIQRQTTYFITNQTWINNFQPLETAFPIDSTIELTTDKSLFPGLLPGLYLAGILILSLRFALQLHHLNRISKKASKHSDNIYVSNSKTAPFSFFGKMFLPMDNCTLPGIQAIIAHERVHINKKHSFDVILVELLCIACWFNPFVFLFKKSLKTIHEFQADAIACKTYTSVNHYLQVLQQSLNVRAGIYHSFNKSTIKKRVQMILKNKNSVWNKLAYLLIIPVLFLSIYAFSSKTSVAQITENFIIPIPNTLPSISPIKESDITKIAAGWGNRVHPIYNISKFHYGIDLVAPEKTPIRATADGIISVKESRNVGYGNKIIIQHNDTLKTLYAHLSAFNCELNDQVRKGDIIGYVGQTGTSTEPHLHYEVMLNGKRVDPADYLDFKVVNSNTKTNDNPPTAKPLNDKNVTKVNG